MNTAYFNSYLQTLEQQLDDLQKALLPFITLEEDLPMVDQIHLQGYLSTQSRVRFELIVGSLKGLLVLANRVETDIKDYLHGHEGTDETS